MDLDVYTVLGILVFLGLILFAAAAIRAVCIRLRTVLDLLIRLLSGAQEQEPPPRSLNGYEPTLLPLIRKDFPDYDPVLAKTRVREYLQQQFQNKPAFTVHKVVIARYLNDGLQKTVVFQAALSWKQGTTVQKRYDVYSSFLLPQGRQAVAANCPNCGATLGFGQVECSYCGSRVANALDQHWEFTRIQES